MELGRLHPEPDRILQLREADHVLVDVHIGAHTDHRADALLMQLTEPLAINEAPIHNQPPQRPSPQARRAVASSSLPWPRSLSCPGPQMV